MPLNLEPLRIVERSACDAAPARQHLSPQSDRRTAGDAKLHSYPTIAFVRPVFVRLQLAAHDFNILLSKIQNDPKGAARPPLTEGAMTRGGHNRGIAHSITHGPTKTSTFMCVGHCSILPVECAG
jgi:hypothetical protein